MRAPMAVYALTPAGARLAASISAAFTADVYLARSLGAWAGLPKLDSLKEATSFDSLPELLHLTFRQYPQHVFITAAGIAVRCIAPLLAGKDKDPAVLVMDQEGKFVVSLLSGHMGGANALARSLAGLVGGQAVITTATDSAALPSLDMAAQERGLAIVNLTAVKVVNAALLRGERVQVRDPADSLGLRCPEWAGLFEFVEVLNPQLPGVWVEAAGESPAGENPVDESPPGESPADGADAAPGLAWPPGHLFLRPLAQREGGSKLYSGIVELHN